MSSLLDLVNVQRKVPVMGLDIAVYGVSAEGFGALLTRFPEIARAMSGLQPNSQELMKLAPKAVAAMIAAGCGKPGDEEYEKIAATLGVQDQLNLLTDILKLTFPMGVRPFVEQLKALGLLVQAEEARLQSSQEQSTSSTEPVTPTH